MNQNQYETLYERWINRDRDKIFWTNELAIEFSASSSEGLRSSFRRWRKTKDESTEERNTIFVKSNTGSARVCVFDLEFSPCVSYNFELFNINISPDQIISHPFMLSWSAKMLNEPTVYSDVLTGKEAINQDDYRIVNSLRELLNTCQVLIGHNINSYDLKKFNTRLLKHNLPPLVKFQTVDTLAVAKQSFDFPSNSLKYINSFLQIKEKQTNEGFVLWKKCMDGDDKALQEMDSYCQGDVLATEDLYYRVRPFVKGHPNLALYHESEEERCPNCGSESLKDEGYYFTPAGKWESLRCEDCGAVSRSKQNELSKDKRKSLKVN